MGDTTGISWTDATFNLWWGCTKVGGSPACENCYAETWANRMGFKVWGNDAPRRYFGEAHFLDLFRWNAAAEKKGERRRVFCMSMGDWAEGRPAQRPYLEQLWKLIPECESLDFLMLTKRPQLMPLLMPKAWRDNPRPNVWLGITADTQEWLDQRWSFLKRMPAAVYWFSMEPIFSQMTLPADFLSLRHRAWVISGGESGHGARPMHPEVPRGLRDQCVKSGVPYHFKQWGEWSPLNDGKSRSMFVPGNNGSLPMYRVGKKAAGHLLDGREWQEFPLGQSQRLAERELLPVLTA